MEKMRFPCLALSALLFFTHPIPVYAMAQKGNSMPVVSDQRLEGLVHAPDFPDHLDWLNTDKPVSLKALRGKIVLLDFWTYCCINCMHVIPDLKKLEAKYPDELVVIGVHSAKFQNEKQTDSIRQAIMRYEIKHPVLNDKDMEVWNQYGVNSWPTVVLINPNGRVIGMQSGEGVFELFDGVISQAVNYFSAKGQLKRSPLKLTLEEAKRPNTLLSFPGKIHADQKGQRLFISDSNHNRIVVTDPEGKVLEVIGSGTEGAKDGSFEESEFNHPQGTFLDGDRLYIADTENHLIRIADLKARSVKTLFGTGEQARSQGSRGIGTAVPLNSPWDLLMTQGKLFVAMAGAHQIYIADPVSLEIEPFAGSGQEARIDGLLKKSALAQPSGITTDGKRLFFADSEVSSVRAADLDSKNPGARVETLIGEDLFEFGDIDGGISTARLQHALGIVYHEGRLYVADTYNSKIKIIDPLSKNSASYAGTGGHGLKDGALKEAQFFEPGGLAVLNGKFYIADTNNHQIRILDPASQTVSTLAISGLEAMAKHSFKSSFRGRSLLLKNQVMGEGRGVVRLSFKIPEGYKFNAEAPLHVEWKSEGRGSIQFNSKSNQLDGKQVSYPFEIPVQTALGTDQLTFDAMIYYCRKDSTVCLFDQIRVIVPVEVKKAGPARIDLQIDVAAKN